MLGAEGTAGVVALLLGERNLAVETAKDVNHAREVVEVSFRIIRLRELLKEDLRETSGRGLKADFGELGSIVATEKTDEMILVQAILEDSFLFKALFEVAASSPVGNVALSDGVAFIVESGD